MNKLDEMWAALAAYQPQADVAGHGPSWAKMCSEKTYGAAAAAVLDGDAAADADAAYAYVAATAANDAATAADAAFYAAYYATRAATRADDAAAAYYCAASTAVANESAQKAINRINAVLVKPAPPQAKAQIKKRGELIPEWLNMKLAWAREDMLRRLFMLALGAGIILLLMLVLDVLAAVAAVTGVSKF